MKKVWPTIKYLFIEAKKDIKDKILDYNRIYRLNKDLCIRVLKYGDNHPEGFTFKEIKEHLRLNDIQAEYLKNLIKYGEVFKSHKYVKTENGIGVSKENLLMTFDDKFRLMQYLELKEAMKSSRNALRVAVASIMIAIIFGFYQIILEIISLQK